MREWSIMDALKSLDEIEAEEQAEALKAKEKFLTESKKKKKEEDSVAFMGDPDVATAAFNKATDVGASSPTTGLGEGVSAEEKSPEDKPLEESVEDLEKQIEWCEKVLSNPYGSDAADAKANYGDNWRKEVKADLVDFKKKLRDRVRNSGKGAVEESKEPLENKPLKEDKITLEETEGSAQTQKLLSEIHQCRRNIHQIKKDFKEGKLSATESQKQLSEARQCIENNKQLLNQRLSESLALTEDLLTEGAESFYMMWSSGGEGHEEGRDIILKGSLQEVLEKAKGKSTDDSVNHLMVFQLHEGNLGDVVFDYTKPLLEATSFNVKDPEEMQQAAEFKKENEDAEDDTLVIVDPEKTPDDEISDEDYLGQYALRCTVCGTVSPFEKGIAEASLDEETSLYGKDELTCPHCGKSEGFTLVGEISTPEDVDEEKPEEEKSEEKEESEEKEDDKKLEPAEGEETVDLTDLDEIAEDTFDGLMQEHLTSLYDNVTSYHTTDISQPSRDKVLIEGVVTYNSGKENKVTFDLYEQVDGKIAVFNLANEDLFGKDAFFRVNARVEGNKLICENFSYKYDRVFDGEEYTILSEDAAPRN